MSREGALTRPLRLRGQANAAAGGERGDVRSRLSGQPHDRNLAIGLLLVFAIARSDLRNTGQRLSPLRPLQGLTANLEPLCPALQPDVVGMLCHVEKPGRVAGGSAERGGDEPRVLSVRKAPDRGCPCAPRLRSTRGEKDHGEPRARTDTLLARAAVRPRVPLADELDERNRHPRSASATGIETNGHVRCLEKPPGAFTQRLLAAERALVSSDATAWGHIQHSRVDPCQRCRFWRIAAVVVGGGFECSWEAIAKVPAGQSDGAELGARGQPWR